MNEEAQAALLKAANSTTQAMAENHHTKKQEKKDYSEVRNELARAEQGLREAREALQQ